MLTRVEAAPPPHQGTSCGAAHAAAFAVSLWLVKSVLPQACLLPVERHDTVARTGNGVRGLCIWQLPKRTICSNE